MSLITTKGEVAAVIEILDSPADPKGAPWTADAMAKAIVNRISELREAREQWFLVYALGPSGPYGMEGPFATKDAAVKGGAKMPILNLAAAVVPVSAYGPKFNRAREQEAVDRPSGLKADSEIALDQAALRRGWKGNMRDRQQYLPGRS